MRLRSDLLGLALLGAILAGAAAAPGALVAAKTLPGLANIASAGSLQLLMDKYLGPPFIKATGDQYQNQSAGSQSLAHEIAAGEIAPDVFIPIGQAPMAVLEPKLTKWAVRFAASPLVVAYYPKGPHAQELRRIAEHKLPIKDLFKLMAQPGFRLGRTDPNVDPQGQGFVEMVHLAERYIGISKSTAGADLGGANAGAQIFSETGLEPTLQAGQLDAASAYLPQAVQLGLPYVTLPAKINFGVPADSSIYNSASMTLAHGKVVHGSLLDLEASVLTTSGTTATDRAAATAFVKFLLGSKARRILKREGYTLLDPALVGHADSAPASVRKLVRKS